MEASEEVDRGEEFVELVDRARLHLEVLRKYDAKLEKAQQSRDIAWQAYSVVERQIRDYTTGLLR